MVCTTSWFPDITVILTSKAPPLEPTPTNPISISSPPILTHVTKPSSVWSLISSRQHQLFYHCSCSVDLLCRSCYIKRLVLTIYLLALFGSLHTSKLI